jgi:hypothetical protein
VKYDAALIEADSITRAQFDELMEFGYHEGQHASDYFDVARLKVGNAEFEKAWQEYGFKPSVLEEARRNPMDAAHPRAANAEKVYESVFTKAGNANRNAVYDAKGAAEAAYYARAAQLKKLPKSRLGLERTRAEEAVKAAEAEYYAKDDVYRKLPEEVSAYAAGGERRAWAGSGLDARYKVRVDAASEVLDSARLRKIDADVQLMKFRGKQGVDSDIVREAEVAVALAGDDVNAAESALQAALSSR